MVAGARRRRLGARALGPRGLRVRADRIRDAGGAPPVDGLLRLLDATLARLRPGALRTLSGLLEGLDNQEMADRESISASANSQRVRNNDLRPLADAIRALGEMS